MTSLDQPPTLLRMAELAVRRLQRAARLCGATVAWNLTIGGAAVATAVATASLSLIGFGINAVVDSSVSSLLVWRFRAEASGLGERARFVEQLAVRVAGAAFAIVAVYVLVRAALSLVSGKHPGSSLFGGSARDETTAHFTLFSVTHMTGRSINEPIHAVQASGPLSLYWKAKPGASFDHPTSFKTGKLIATFHTDIQSIVNVTAPTKGIETLTGSLHQTVAHRFTMNGTSHLLGGVGLHQRVTATGDGTLLEPTEPKATLLLAGTIVVTS